MIGKEIKKLILDSGLKCWQVAYAYGLSDGNFSRRLRRPFSEEETQRIQEIIEKLKKEGGAENA